MCVSEGGWGEGAVCHGVSSDGTTGGASVQISAAGFTELFWSEQKLPLE